MDNTTAYYPSSSWEYPQPLIPLLSSSSCSRATAQGGATPSHDGRASVATIPPPHHLHQLPFAPYAPQSYVPLASFDEVRTLFIAGLPGDVKPREIYNLLREFPGYESSHLRAPSANTQPFAFAIFLDQQSAVAAMHALNGLVFDLEKNSTLYLDLAKSNSRSKRSRIDNESSVSEKRINGSRAFSRGNPDSGVSSIHMPGMGNSAYNMFGYPSTQSHGSFDGMAVSCCTAAKLNNSSVPCVPRNITPCATLFVANLGPTCSEQELIQVFSRCPGYLKLKMQSRNGSPVAFVDFQDAACSSESVIHLQGTILYSSPLGESMRLEYAKSRMGCAVRSRNKCKCKPTKR